MPGSERRPSASAEPELGHELESVLWRSVLTHAKDAIIIIDARGLIRMFNRCAEEMFGYGAEEVLGQNISILVPNSFGDHDAHLHRYYQTGVRIAIDNTRPVTGRRKNGETFPIELSVSETSLESGKYFTGIARDLTRIRELEAQLRQERDFATRLVDTAPTIVLVLDSEGRTVQFNRYFEGLTGRTLEETRGQPWAKTFLAPQEQERFHRDVGRAMSGLQLRGEVFQIPNSDAKPRAIEWCMTALESHDEFKGVLCVGQDISERLNAEESAHAYQRLANDRERLADFAALIAQLVHDLGNPLAGLSVHAQLIRDTARRELETGGQLYLDSAEKILAEARRLEVQVRGLLTFSRNQQRFEIRRIQAADFVDSVAALWGPVAHSHGIVLHPSIAAELESFEGEEETLRRVVENLIKNAIEAIGTGPGSIALEASSLEEGGLRIEVSDDGPGVANEATMFRLFATSKPKGSGLGLALSRQLIRSQGGELKFTPNLPRGARFIVDLPARSDF